MASPLAAETAVDDEDAVGAEDDRGAAETPRGTSACWAAEVAWPLDAVELFRRKLGTDGADVRRYRDLPSTAFQLLRKFNDEITGE